MEGSASSSGVGRSQTWLPSRSRCADAINVTVGQLFSSVREDSHIIPPCYSPSAHAQSRGVKGRIGFVLLKCQNVKNNNNEDDFKL